MTEPATRRRLRRIEYHAKYGKPIPTANAEAGGVEVEQPHSSEEETPLTSPPEMEVESDEADTEADTSPVEAEASGATKTALTGKRKPDAGPTPPEGKKRKKGRRTAALGSTFEQAEKSSLLGVVLIRDQPHTILSRTQLDQVRHELLTKLGAAIESGLDLGVTSVSKSDPT